MKLQHGIVVGIALLALEASGCVADGSEQPDQPGQLSAQGERILARTGPPAGSPRAPTNLAATIVSSSEVRLTWIDVSNETQYHIDRGENVDCSDGSGPNCVQFVDFPRLPANTTTFTDNTVHLDGSYTWRVQACNAAGCGNHEYANAFLQ